MSTIIEIPSVNLQNITNFPDEPDGRLVEEIREHIRLTSKPHTWRGHSHTRPPEEAFVVYVEEFDVPAPDSVPRVAPCPCCTQFHAKYKNKGKIAWFPNESVIRLIGPDCFAAINSEGHKDALIELRKKRKVRQELASIALHAPTIGALIKAIDEAIPIAKDLDVLMNEMNDVIDNKLTLNLWRNVKGGNLTIAKPTQITFQKANGTDGTRTDYIDEPFATISGHTLIDRSGKKTKNKLTTLRAGLVQIELKLKEKNSISALEDEDRKKFATTLPKARVDTTEMFALLLEKQLFLTTTAIDTLNRWGRNENAPIPFSIKRNDSTIFLSKLNVTHSEGYYVAIGKNATKKIPNVPNYQSE